MEDLPRKHAQEPHLALVVVDTFFRKPRQPRIPQAAHGPLGHQELQKGSREQVLLGAKNPNGDQGKSRRFRINRRLLVL